MKNSLSPSQYKAQRIVQARKLQENTRQEAAILKATRTERVQSWKDFIWVMRYSDGSANALTHKTFEAIQAPVKIADSDNIGKSVNDSANFGIRSGIPTFFSWLLLIPLIYSLYRKFK